MIFKYHKEEYPSLHKEGALILKDIYDIWKEEENNASHPYRIYFLQKNHPNHLVAAFSSENERNEAYQKTMNALEQTHNNNLDTTMISRAETINKKFNIMDHIKGFIDENKQTIYWIAIILLVDQIFLDGSLRTKTKDLFDSLINRLNKKINE